MTRTNLKSNAAVIKIFQSAVTWADQQSDEQQRCQMYLLNIKPRFEIFDAQNSKKNYHLKLFLNR